jgi:hypothetical protein
MSIVKINDVLKVDGNFKVISSSTLPSDNTPTYALYRSPSITDEGTTVTYTLATTNVAEGTLVSYTVTGISQADLSSGSLNGNFTVGADGTATVSFDIANDELTEGTETMLLSSGGQSLDVTINDTSISPDAILLLNGNGIVSSANRMIANESGYNYPFVRTGTPTLAFDDLTNSPSVYFDGSGDYYTIPIDHTVPFRFSSGTFTVELWVKFDTVANYNGTDSRTIIGNYNSTTTGWTIGMFNGKLKGWLSGDVPDINGTTQLSPNVWYHIALVGSNGSYKLYLNGLKEGNTYTGAVRIDGGAVGIAASVGRVGYIGNQFKGYIKGIRAIENTAIYTQNFSDNLPATPFENVANTILLINPYPSIIDSTGKNRFITTLGNSINASPNNKFGIGSLYFDGTNSALKIPATSDLAFGTGDFTIEFWCNFTDANAVSSVARRIFSHGVVNANRMQIIIANGSNPSGVVAGSICMYTTALLGANTVVAVNDAQYHHIAFTRSSGVLRCFVDGVLKSTVNNITNFNDTSTPYYIGSYGTYTSGFYKGYLDDFRIIKDYALYTQNFTPPTEGLTA